MPNGVRDAVKASKRKAEKTKKAQRGDPVSEFLMDRVPKWDLEAQLSSLGLDSLDMVQLRNSFNAAFGTRLTLGLFAAPSQTLQELRDKLVASVATADM